MKKVFTRTLSLLMISTLLFVLAACGKSNPVSEETKDTPENVTAASGESEIVDSSESEDSSAGNVEMVTFEGYDNYKFEGIRLTERKAEELSGADIGASIYEENCENPSIDSQIKISIMESTGTGMTLTNKQGTTSADYFLVENPTDQRIWLHLYVFSTATGEEVGFTRFRLGPGETGILEDEFAEGQILGHEDEYEIKYYTQLLDPREEISSSATEHRVYMLAEDTQTVEVIIDSLVDYDVYGRFEIFFFKDGVIVNSHRLNSDFGITPVQGNGSGFITWDFDMGVDFDSYFIQLDMGTDSSVTNYGF